MGISGKHVVKTFGPFKDIKVRYVAYSSFQNTAVPCHRFVGIVYPGETLITEMWKEGDKVMFGKLQEWLHCGQPSEVSDHIRSYRDESKGTRDDRFKCCRRNSCPSRETSSHSQAIVEFDDK
jgi:hypothetical protein